MAHVNLVNLEVNILIEIQFVADYFADETMTVHFSQ